MLNAQWTTVVNGRQLDDHVLLLLCDLRWLKLIAGNDKTVKSVSRWSDRFVAIYLFLFLSEYIMCYPNYDGGKSLAGTSVTALTRPGFARKKHDVESGVEKA